MLNIKIIDDDSDFPNFNDFIDQIDITLKQTDESIPIVYHGYYNVATMTISYNIYCDRNYYGPNCTEYCQTIYNDTGLYECDEQGRLTKPSGIYKQGCLKIFYIVLVMIPQYNDSVETDHHQGVFLYGYTVKPVYSGYLGAQQNCPYYRGVLISEVHSYYSGTTVNCPYYRGVLIMEVSLFQSVHNSRFDCTVKPRGCASLLIIL